MDSHRSAGLAWRLSCGCTKALSHPEATICQYQEGHCVLAGLSIVVCVCLSWLSPLYQQRPTQREETMLSVESVSLSWLPLTASLGASAGTDTEYQSACRALKLLSLFISQCHPHWSQHTRPSSLSPVLIFFFQLVPWNSQTKGWGTVGRREGRFAAKTRQSGSISTLHTLELEFFFTPGKSITLK